MNQESKEPIFRVVQVICLPSEDRRIELAGTKEQIKKVASDRGVSFNAIWHFEDLQGHIIEL